MCVDNAQNTSSKKIDCPFNVIGATNIDRVWEVVVNNITYNYDLTNTLEGHAFVGKLKEEVVKFVVDLIKRRVKPVHIPVVSSGRVCGKCEHGKTYI